MAGESKEFDDDVAPIRLLRDVSVTLCVIGWIIHAETHIIAVSLSHFPVHTVRGRKELYGGIGPF